MLTLVAQGCINYVIPIVVTGVIQKNKMFLFNPRKYSLSQLGRTIRYET